jgi:hypothetical protein
MVMENLGQRMRHSVMPRAYYPTMRWEKRDGQSDQLDSWLAGRKEISRKGAKARRVGVGREKAHEARKGNRKEMQLGTADERR